MPLTAEQKKKITDPDVLAAVEKDESIINDVTQESIGRKNKLRENDKIISALNAQIDKIKAAGLDPDGELEDQLNARIDALKEKGGLKSASELEKVNKQLEKMQKDWEAEKNLRIKSEKDALQEKVSSELATRLPEHFGKFAKNVHDLVMLKGLGVIKDGKKGVLVGDDFYPFDADKGTESGIDVIKKMFPNMVEVKQKGGSSGGGKGATGNGESDVETMTLVDLEKLPMAEKMGKLALAKEGKLKIE